MPFLINTNMITDVYLFVSSLSISFEERRRGFLIVVLLHKRLRDSETVDRITVENNHKNDQ